MLSVYFHSSSNVNVVLVFISATRVCMYFSAFICAHVARCMLSSRGGIATLLMSILQLNNIHHPSDNSTSAFPTVVLHYFMGMLMKKLINFV